MIFEILIALIALAIWFIPNQRNETVGLILPPEDREDNMITQEELEEFINEMLEEQS